MSETEINLHPAPAPVKLTPKAVKEIIHGACLDCGWEDLNEDDPETLLVAFGKVAQNVAYVEILMSGELTEGWAVLETKRRFSVEIDWIAKELGTALLWVDQGKRGRRKTEKRVRKLRARARTITEAIEECNRWWDEDREYDKDREAAERLGLAGGDG